MRVALRGRRRVPHVRPVPIRREAFSPLKPFALPLRLCVQRFCLGVLHAKLQIPPSSPSRRNIIYIYCSHPVMKNLLRSTTLTLLAFAAVAINAHAQDRPRESITNPSDVDFQARLVSDSHAFHTGEPIQIEISYSSDAEKKYRISRVNPNPNLGGVIPHLSSAEGITDLSVLLRDPEGGFGGSFISGGPEYLLIKPVTQVLDLSAWYRFQKPGHYSLEVSSNSVWRMKSVEEGGTRESIELNSNAVEFEILPHSDEWDAAELAEIEQTLNTAKFPGERLAPIQRMAYLDTPAAIGKVVTLFLKTSNDSEGWLIYSGLRESSQSDLIIQFLLAALNDATVSIPPLLPQLLSELQTRKELGVQGPAPTDPAQKTVWDQKLKERYKIRDGYLARDNAQLLASIQLRTGPQRAMAIYQAWSDAERLNVSAPQPSNVLSQLRQEALNVQHELQPYQRLELVRSSLQVFPQDQLLPIIRDLTRDTSPNNSGIVFSAFELWCKNWQASCNMEILHRAGDPATKLSKLEFLMLSESEHTELDALIQEKLSDLNALKSGLPFNNLSTLVFRVGSKNLVPTVDGVLDIYATTERRDCEAQAYFIGYLFRFNQKDASSRLSAMIQNPSDQCGASALGFLGQAGVSDALLPIAMQGLNSPNFASAAPSAIFIATHAPDSAKAALWQRLDALHRDWRDRAAQLQSSSYSWGSSPQEQAAMLELQLASAIANAANWKLSDSERASLRDGCLTDQCRNVADGKIRYGM
jgi:hypothetical protein